MLAQTCPMTTLAVVNVDAVDGHERGCHVDNVDIGQRRRKGGLSPAGSAQAAPPRLSLAQAAPPRLSLAQPAPPRLSSVQVSSGWPRAGWGDHDRLGGDGPGWPQACTSAA